MRFFERSHVYNADFETVTAAWFVKYPNPETQHVKEIHTVAREISDHDGRLWLRRLFYLEYGMPSWVQKLMKRRMEGYAVEEVTCEVGKEGKYLRAVGRNVTFSSFFQMEETIEYRPAKDDPQNKTQFTQKMQFRVMGMGPILGSKLETAARDSAEKKSNQGLQVMENVIQRLRKMEDVIPDAVKKEAEIVEDKIMTSISLHP
jgi:hypothetical protein